VYQVSLAATDFSTNRSGATVTVTVPHDQGGGTEPLLLRVKPVSAGGVQVDWPGVSGAIGYDLISGDLRNWRIHKGVLALGDVRVLARGTSQAHFVEPAGATVPAVGSAVFYLLQARTAAEPTGFGTESAPWERVPTTCDGGCP
jgi:hypothetical protein